jgi:hypothetical protein
MGGHGHKLNLAKLMVQRPMLLLKYEETWKNLNLSPPVYLIKWVGLKLNLILVSEHGLWTTFLIVQWEQDSLALVIIHKSGG